MRPYSGITASPSVTGSKPAARTVKEPGSSETMICPRPWNRGNSCVTSSADCPPLVIESPPTIGYCPFGSPFDTPRIRMPFAVK